MNVIFNRSSRILALYLLVIASALSQGKDCQPHFSLASLNVSPTHLTSLMNLDDVNKLSIQGRSSLGGEKALKVVYMRDLKDAHKSKIYFINSNKFAYHVDFVNKVLGINVTAEIFNKNYQGDGAQRSFNLGTLVLQNSASSSSGNQLLLELWNGDTLSGPYLAEFFQKVQEGIEIPKASLVYHPMGVAQEMVIKKLNENIDKSKDSNTPIPYVTTHDLYQGQNFQILNDGVGVGILKFVDSEAELSKLDYTQIAVLKSAPNDIGLVGGVVTEEFQTPLSHVNVKSINRGTFNLGLKNATTLLKDFENKPVRIEVGPQFPTGYKITELSSTDAEKMINDFWQDKKPKTALNPVAVLHSPFADHFQNFKDIFPSRSRITTPLHQRMLHIFGAKATNLAALKKMVTPTMIKELGVVTPEGMAIPFDFYEEFITTPQAGLDDRDPQRIASLQDVIAEKLDTLKGMFALSDKLKVMDSIRQLVAKAKVPQKLLQEFKRNLMDDISSPLHQSKVARIRLRSSTNSEDLEGFNGAGLYNSDGLNLRAKDGSLLSWEAIEKKLEEKIRFIYSSVWNDRAFEEREWYSLTGRDHLKVKVGVALHGAFSNEEGNGVAMTKNINGDASKYEEFSKIYINAQHYDLAVTNPPLPEELQKFGEDPSRPYSSQQILVTPFLADYKEDGKRQSWHQWSFENISLSSLKNQTSVLNDEETLRLARALKDVSDQFAIIYGKDPDKFILDTEWKVETLAATSPNAKFKRTLTIKQARPLTDK